MCVFARVCVCVRALKGTGVNEKRLKEISMALVSEREGHGNTH